MMRPGQKRLMQAYMATFDSPAGRVVLKDLHDFCGAAMDIDVADTPNAAKAIGMRRVWLRIQSYRNMTERDVSKLAQQETQRDE